MDNTCKVIHKLKRNRKIRKVKKIRLYTFTVILFTILFGSISFAQSPAIESDKYEKVIETVTSDNLPWEIQAKLAPNSDTRELLAIVSQLNNCELSQVKDGQSLIFLKEN